MLCNLGFDALYSAYPHQDIYEFSVERNLWHGTRTGVIEMLESQDMNLFILFLL